MQTTSNSRPVRQAVHMQPSPRAASSPPVRDARRTPRRHRRHWSALLWVAPAFTTYAVFVLYPLLQSVQYSFYDWDGIGPATWVGLDNWKSIFTQPELLHSVENAFILI